MITIKANIILNNLDNLSWTVNKVFTGFIATRPKMVVADLEIRW